MNDFEDELRAGLAARRVAFDAERAADMIRTATAGVPLAAHGRWVAPAAAAAAVVVVGGGVGLIAAGHDHGADSAGPAGPRLCTSSAVASTAPAPRGAGKIAIGSEPVLLPTRSGQTVTLTVAPGTGSASAPTSAPNTGGGVPCASDTSAQPGATSSMTSASPSSPSSPASTSQGTTSTGTPSTGSLDPGPATGTAGGTVVTLELDTPVGTSRDTTSVLSVGQRTFAVTSLTMTNETAGSGTLSLRRGEQSILMEGLQRFRRIDYSFPDEPVVFTRANPPRLHVECAAATGATCHQTVVLTGHLAG